MSNNPGTLVIAPVRPQSTDDTYPSAIANEILGGYKTFATIEERDALPDDRRVEGEMCYVVETDTLYVLKGGIDNGDWTTASPTSIVGTPNQIIVTQTLGEVVLSAPQDIASTSSPTFVGLTLSGPITGATIAAGSNTITGLTNSNLSGSAGITNANLANSSITVTAGSNLNTGGTVALGGSVTLNVVNNPTFSGLVTAQNALTVSAGGANITGNSIIQGTVATSASNALLVRNSASTALLTVRNDGLITVGNGLLVTTGGATITGGTIITGNLGVGSSSSPLSNLHVRGTSLPGTITISNTSTAITTGALLGVIDFYTEDASDIPDKVVASIKATAEGDFVGVNNAATSLTFWTHPNAAAAAERMRITGAGLVGIGTTPTTRLHVLETAGGSVYAATISHTGGTVGRNGLFINTAGTSATSLAIKVTTGVVTDAFQVTGDGRVGVGTVAPSARIHVGTGTASIIGSLTEAIAITSTTDGARVGLYLGVPDGSNNRRVQLFLDDSTGLYGFETSHSSGAAEFVINNTTGERFRVAQNQVVFNNAVTNSADLSVVFRQNHVGSNVLVDIDRANDVRRAVFRFSTAAVLNWAVGMFRNGGVTQNNFSIGPDDSNLATAALTIDTSNRVGISTGTTALTSRVRIIGNNESDGALSIAAGSGTPGTLIKYGSFTWASTDGSGHHYLSWGMRFNGSTLLWDRTYTAATNFLPYIQVSTLSMVHIGGATSSSTGDANPTLSPFASFDMVNRRMGLNDAAPTYILDIQDSGTNGVPSARLRNTAAAGYAQFQISRVSTSRGAAVTFAVGTTIEWWAGTIYGGGGANTGWSLVPGTTNTVANAVFHVTTTGIFGMGMAGSPATYSRLDVNGLITFGTRDGAGNRASGHLGNSWTSGAGFNYSYLGSSYYDGTNWITNPGTQFGSNYVAQIVQDIQGIKFMTQGNTGNTTRTDSAATFATYERMRMDLTGRMGLGVTTITAVLHLKAGTATAGTAPLKFTSGTNLTTAEAGVMEYNGTNLFFTRAGTTREGVLTQSAVTTEALVSDTSVTVNINGVTYKLLARA